MHAKILTSILIFILGPMLAKAQIRKLIMHVEQVMSVKCRLINVTLLQCTCFSTEKNADVDVADVNQKRCFEESEEWLRNVDQAHQYYLVAS